MTERLVIVGGGAAGMFAAACSQRALVLVATALPRSAAKALILSGQERRLSQKLHVFCDKHS